jgi:hypothetical protein
MVAAVAELQINSTSSTDSRDRSCSLFGATAALSISPGPLHQVCSSSCKDWLPHEQALLLQQLQQQHARVQTGWLVQEQAPLHQQQKQQEQTRVQSG